MRSTLLVALFLSVAVGAVAQPADSMSTRQAMLYKDPGTATLVGVLIPGAGHMYAGETAKGLGVMAASAGSVATGYYFSTCPGVEGQCSPTFLYVGIGLHFANWIWSIVDAGDAAQRHNRRLGIAEGQIQVCPVAKPGNASQQGTYGIAVSLNF